MGVPSQAAPPRVGSLTTVKADLSKLLEAPSPGEEIHHLIKNQDLRVSIIELFRCIYSCLVKSMGLDLVIDNLDRMSIEATWLCN